tara:strand:+ start:4896 stop:5180 length:285 start_codon:yes stop_codon:yes gene_type:complete
MKHSTVIDDKNIIKKVTGKEVVNPTDCCNNTNEDVLVLILSWDKGYKRNKTSLTTVCCFTSFGEIDTKYFDEIDKLNNHNLNKLDLIDYLDKVS